jgi:uncharacterized protein YqfA (UPF0365 family)
VSTDLVNLVSPAIERSFRQPKMVFTTEQEMRAKLRELQGELVNAKKIIAMQGKALQDTNKDTNQ